MKNVYAISRILVGLVFTFSGFVKAVDPMGSTFKFKDYFSAFHLEMLAPMALTLAIVLSTLEFVVGVALLFNARTRIASWGALLFMAIFTPLTLVLALTNPVTDCGCFGDALILTNWETFGKNIVLMFLTLVIFKHSKKMVLASSVKEQLLLLSCAILFSVGISINGLSHLPLIDFRPYHVGANIEEGMKIPPGAPSDQYKSIFIYKKNGVSKEFDESNYPWQDSTWKFVDAKQIKTKEGYHPPIHDFSISNDAQGDITDLILKDKGYTFIVVSRNLEELDPKYQKQINELASFCQVQGYGFIGLTASMENQIKTFKEVHNIPFTFYNTDEIQLKTIIRANPGLILLQQGTILEKWHPNDLPEVEQLQRNLTALSLSQGQKKENRLIIICITSTLLLLLCFYQMIKYRSIAIKNRLRL